MSCARSALLAGVALALGLATALTVEAQPAKVRRIGWLSHASAPPGNVDPWYMVPIFQGLRERGWVEGQNLVIERRYSDFRADRLSAHAAELVQLKVELILTLNSPTAIAAKHATATIPIVFATVSDPVGDGLIKSFARPGGNLTGLGGLSAAMPAKQLELLKELVPGASRVAVLWNPAIPVQARALDDLQEAARRLGLSLERVELRSPDDLDDAFATLAQQRPHGVVVLGSPFMSVLPGSARIAKLAAEHRLPAIHGLKEVVEAGGLISYGPAFMDAHQRLPYYIDRILGGAKPDDLPVEQPTRFYLTINRGAAKALGLTIPQSVLLRADRVIE